ncbi:hypothetical protein M758_UG207500 [Ceratodon purpureus]|nr:hypothetical protein M758_UG207500 [Ceratodon purpureus]
MPRTNLGCSTTSIEFSSSTSSRLRPCPDCHVANTGTRKQGQVSSYKDRVPNHRDGAQNLQHKKSTFSDPQLFRKSPLCSVHQDPQLLRKSPLCGVVPRSYFCPPLDLLPLQPTATTQYAHR